MCWGFFVRIKENIVSFSISNTMVLNLLLVQYTETLAVTAASPICLQLHSRSRPVLCTLMMIMQCWR